MEKSDDKDFGPDRQNAQLQTLADQAFKAPRSRRKQQNPQRKKVEMHATRGDKKKITKKPQQKKRGGEKGRKADKTIVVGETEVANATLQGATKLKERKLSNLIEKESEGINFDL